MAAPRPRYLPTDARPVSSRSHWLVPLAVLLVGWTACAGMFWHAFTDQRRSETLEFKRLSVAAETALLRRIEIYIDGLDAAASFLRASYSVERSEWREFAASLDLDGRYPGVRGIGVIYPITATERNAFLTHVRADGAPDFAVHAAPNSDLATDTDDWAVVTFMEPAARNTGVAGLNIMTESRRREAALAARDTGQPRMTRQVELIQDGLHRPGALLFVPVYRAGTHPESMEERRRDFMAWVSAPFVIEELFQAVLRPEAASLWVQMYAGTEPSPEALLYESGQWIAGAKVPKREAQVTLAGQVFTIVWRQGESFAPGPVVPMMWASAFGTVVVGLIALLVYALGSTTRRAQAMARELTRDMAAAQRELEASLQVQRSVLDSSVHSIIGTLPNGIVNEFNTGAERMLGYQREEVVGKLSVLRMHVPAEIGAHANELRRELGRQVDDGFEALVAKAALGRADEHEWTYVRRDGSTFPILLSVTAQHGERGEITGYLAIASDLTDRKNAEAARKATEQRLAEVLGHAECLVWEANVVLSEWKWEMTAFPSGLFRRLMGMFGGPVEHGLWRHFHVPAQAEMDMRSRDAMTRGLPGYSQEFEIRTNHESLWIRESVAIHREGPDRFRLIGVAFDITDRKLAEAALRQNKNFLKTITSILPGMVAYWTRDLRCAFSNAEYLAWFGRTEDQMQNVTLFELLGPELFAKNEPYMREALAGRPQRFERQMRTPDGSIKEAWVQYTPDFEPDQVTVRGFLAVVSDITEMKQTEAALRQGEARLRSSLQEITNLKTALDAHAIVSITDAKGVITYVNDRFLKVSKYSREELLGQSHRVVNSGRHARSFFQGMWSTISEGRIWHGEVCNRAKDGSFYWLDATIVPFLGEEGRPTQYISIRTDITERKQLEQSLAVARDEALEGSRLKSEFLATMSHEIRTPMNAIIGMAGLLAETPLNTEQSDMVRIVTGAAESLLTIINDILDFSKIESGQLRLDVAPFDFARVVEEIVALMAPRAHEKRIELNYEFNPTPSAMLLGDAGRVRQILLNLIGNAVKFTDAGEVSVVATTAPAPGGRSRLRIDVHDTGVGIPPEARDRLFRPFVQVDGSATRRFGGTGLGLAITRQLVTAMGGEVGFESAPGKGSTFWVVLEFAHDGPIRDEPQPAVLSGRRILVVDDNATNRAILARQLAHCGMQAESASDALSALTRLKDPAAPRCDVVVLDWNMPGVTGLELALSIRAEPRLASLPLVMLSSASLNSDVAATSAVGFAALLTKPVTEAKLARCIARVLAEVAGPPRAVPVEVAAVSEAGCGTQGVLLVEDNEANQRVASLLLTKLGYRVELATNGHQALERLAQKRYDVVLMDCQMPYLDGFETARWIRGGKLPGIDARVPIIAVTAYARPEDQSRCVEVGMNGYISKPIRVRELKAALDSVLGPLPTVPAAVLAEAGPIEDLLDPEVLETARGLPGAKGPSLLPELIECYLAEEPARLLRLSQLGAERNAEELALEAHSMAGNAAAFGGIGVRRAALELEDAVRAGRWTDVDTKLRELTDACRRLQSAVRQLGLVS